MGRAFIGAAILLAAIAQSAADNPPYLKFYRHPRLSNFSYCASLGLSHYSGELQKDYTSAKLANLIAPNFALGTHLRLTHWVGLRLQVEAARLSFLPKNADGLNGFRTKQWGGFVGLQHDIFSQDDIDAYFRNYNFYAFGGYGRNYFRPKDAVTEVDYRQTDADGNTSFPKGYSFWALGVGGRYFFNDHILLGGEIAYRFTRTDYLDGLASGGGNDKTLFINLKAEIRFLTGGHFFYRYKSHLHNR